MSPFYSYPDGLNLETREQLDRGFRESRDQASVYFLDDCSEVLPESGSSDLSQVFIAFELGFELVESAIVGFDGDKVFLDLEGLDGSLVVLLDVFVKLE